MSSPNLQRETSVSSTVSGDSQAYLHDNLLDPDSATLDDFHSDFQDEAAPAAPKKAPPPPSGGKGSGRLVIGIDYGTTFTGVAFARASGDHVDLKKIEVIQDWTTRKKANQPNAKPTNQQSSKMSNLRKVPSVISFAKPKHEEAQWGADISHDAISMVNTKLELQAQTRYEELDLTLHLLKGTKNLSFEHIRKSGPEPAYTWRSPTQIIEKYLTKIFETTRKSIDIEQLNLTKTPVDIVVTVPVAWPYQANDAMFRAIREAGFNKTTFHTLKDTLLVSEPEGAAYFTARDLFERGIEFLEIDDCFILCDAGGGTADVVSYQVKKLKPHFELVKATDPDGDKCGSALIDTAFKQWLKDSVLGEENYAKLDPPNAKSQKISPHTAESGPMRQLIKDFEQKKKAYPNPNEPDIRLDLPEPLKGLTIDGKVKEGELLIQADEMKELMDDCVDGVITLIKKQIAQVKDVQERRVRNVFLVGGFGASPYLQDELRKSLELRDMDLRRPDPVSSLTATVQGAVVYGVEKSRHGDCRYMGAILKSYGVVTEGRFDWLIRKGDLLIFNEKRTIEGKQFWCSWKNCTNNKCDFSIYYYKSRKGDDRVPSDWKDGKHEVEQIGVVKADFQKFLARSSQQPPYPDGHPTTLVPGNPEMGLSADKIGPLKWKLQITPTSLVAELFLKEVSLGKCDFVPETDTTPVRKPSFDSSDERDI